MTKKKTSNRAGAKKLRVNKQTIKDLNPKSKAGDVKGGRRCPGGVTRSRCV